MLRLEGAEGNGNSRRKPECVQGPEDNEMVEPTGTLSTPNGVIQYTRHPAYTCSIRRYTTRIALADPKR